MYMLMKKPDLQPYIYYVAWFLCFSIPLPYAEGRLGFLSGIIFLLWTFDGQLKNKLRQLYRCKPFALFVIILAYSTISLLWTDYVEVGLDTLRPYKYFLFIFPPLITSIPREKVKHLVFAFILGLLVHVFAAYLKYFLSFHGVVADKIYLPYSIYGPFTAFGALYFLNKYLHKPAWTYKSVFFVIISLALIVLVFIMPGRSAQLILSIGLVTLLIIHYKSSKNIKMTLIHLSLAVMLVSILVFNLDYPETSYPTAKNEIENAIMHKDYTGSFGARIGLFILGLEAAKKHPVFGAGVGDLRDEFQRIIERGEHQEFYALGFWDTPHNQYITQLVRLGLAGLFAMLAYIYLFLRLEIEDREYKILSMIFIITFGINCFTDEILYMKPYNTYFAVLSALFMNLALPRQQTSSNFS